MQTRIVLLLCTLAAGEKISPEENEKLKTECGTSPITREQGTYKSFGGMRLKPLQYPWMAALKVYKGHKKKGWFLCSAVQISKRHLLTAAHCVVQKSEMSNRICKSDFKKRLKLKRLLGITHLPVPTRYFAIYLGTMCTNPNTCTLSRRHELAKNPIFHEEFDPCAFRNDLAIVELTEDIPDDELVPICMPEKGTVLSRNLTAMGYGFDPTNDEAPSRSDNWLQAVNVDLHDVMKTKDLIRTSAFGRSICVGDSGGPLIQLNERNRHTLVGITSASTTACETPYGTTSLSMFAGILLGSVQRQGFVPHQKVDL